MRSIRTTFVFNLASNYGPIFGITDVRFRANKDGRKILPEVAALLSRKSFLYDHNIPDRVESHLRHPCIIKVSARESRR
jgi:hypothetical protein